MKNLTAIILFLFCNILTLQSQTLKDYLVIAGNNNPGLKAKQKEYEAALQKIEVVNTLPDPNFTFGYFISPVETRVGPQLAKFSIHQMLPWFGTLKLKEEIAGFESDTKYFEYQEYRNKLYYQVIATYYSLAELSQMQKTESANISLLETYKDIALKKYENQSGLAMDYLRADIMINDATTNLKILAEKQRAVEVGFNNLLNRDINEKVILPDSLTIDIISTDYRKDSLLQNNPVVNQFGIKTKISEYNRELVAKQGLPGFQLGIDYIVVGKRTDLTMSDNGKDVLMPTVSVSIPLFRKKYKAAETEAQLKQESYQLQAKDYENTLLSNYESAMFELNQQREFILLYDKQIEESSEILTSLMSAYRNTGKDFEEVLRMQQQVLKYQKLKITAVSQYDTSVAKLNYLTAKQY